MPEKPIAYDAYQRLADHYAAKIDTKPHNAYLDRPAMLGLLPDVNGKRVLDAGCGPGVYAEELVARGADVVGIDVSDRMLEHAAERLKGRVRLERVDMTQPLELFSDGEFDVVNAPLCLDYIKDWTPLFREFHRILKPGGVFLFSAGHPSFDAEHFKTEQYFSVEAVKCVWTGFGIRQTMPSFRRSLEEVFTPIVSSGLVIERVHEPLPTEDFRSNDPRRYQRLIHRPCFLCVRTRRPSLGG